MNKPQKTSQKTIYLGADHAGFRLKEQIKRWLERNNVLYEDQGDLILDPQDDYPDYAERVARKVLEQHSKGILICGSAQGVCIAANKIRGIRAVVPFSLREARLAREHEDANVLCLSGWFFHFHKATQMIQRFLHTPFSGEPRHVRRLNKIKRLERTK